MDDRSNGPAQQNGHPSAGEPSSEPTTELTGMYLRPGWRGTGLADRLIEAVVDRARAEGAGRVRLWVAGPNERAARVYRRRGFRADGSSQPHPHSPEVTEFRMVLRPPTRASGLSTDRGG